MSLRLMRLSLTLTRRSVCRRGSVFAILTRRQWNMLLCGWISSLWDELSRLSLILESLLLISWRPWRTCISCASRRSMTTIVSSASSIIAVGITVTPTISSIRSPIVWAPCVVLTGGRGVTITRILIIRSYQCEFKFCVSYVVSKTCLPKSTHVSSILWISIVTLIPWSRRSSYPTTESSSTSPKTGWKSGSTQHP
jgi:hypothetical protein